MFLSKLRNKKEVISWSFYDFANQPFSTIIVTFIYGAFFTSVIASDEKTGTLLWTNGIAITAIIVSILSPILGALADKAGYRKFFLISFTWICAVFSILLYFPQSGDVFFALSLFVIANIAFELGTVFCNSYLQDLADEKNSGKISGFSWGLGFVGGLLALFLSFSLFELDSSGIRGINILVGVWFLIFSIPTFLFVKDRKKDKLTKKHFLDSFASIRTTFKEVVKYRTIMKFLIARLFFNDGLITIFSLGGIYAIGTLDFSIPEVMTLGIVLNISAAIGSFIFGYLEDKIGVKEVINLSLVVLVFSTLLAFIAPYFIFQKEIFWVAGVLIGLMVGPNQSCSRSLMAKLTPKEKKNEFFGFFALTGKATSFLGPILFGIITFNFSQQVALWVVIFLFLIGLILFNKINFQDE
ncbi:MAG: MFS transporter [Flavobacteriales bacterium]|nr:MFS transporter [Flavobacteriales bacterium]|tara:strand:- start:208 stop:1443 length:1236 start_codon:yes stop_codon:yes gene_type:complete